MPQERQKGIMMAETKLADVRITWDGDVYYIVGLIGSKKFTSIRTWQHYEHAEAAMLVGGADLYPWPRDDFEPRQVPGYVPGQLSGTVCDYCDRCLLVGDIIYLQDIDDSDIAPRLITRITCEKCLTAAVMESHLRILNGWRREGGRLAELAAEQE